MTNFNACPDCGARKNEDYETCFNCARQTAKKENRLCACGKFKKEEFDVCYTCFQAKQGGQEESEDFIAIGKDEVNSPAPAEPPSGANLGGSFDGPNPEVQAGRVPVNSLLFLDTETTGLRKPRLVQLAYKHSNGMMANNVLFRPPKPIEPGAVGVHGITDEAVATLEEFPGSQSFQVLQGLLNTSLLIAHNAAYDISVLKNEGLTVPYHICTMCVARSLWPKAPNHKLQGLRKELGLGQEKEAKAHDAWGDVTVLAELFLEQVRFYRMQTFRPEEEIPLDFIAFTRARS